MSRGTPSEIGLRMLDRRGFLRDAGAGLGGIALAALLGQQDLLADPIRPIIDPAHPSAPRLSHFAPRATKVLMFFCSGALSHIDSWDYKPELIKRHGQPMPGADKLITFQGEQGTLQRSPWEFKPRGQTGKYVSELLPNLAQLTDEFCFVHSMTAKSNTHGPAENQMSTGFTLDGFPSMGAWISYALGSEADDLPAYVAIPDPRGVPQTGPNCWSAGFLPAVFQGVPFNAVKPIPHLASPPGTTPQGERETLDFLKFLNEKHLERYPGDTELAARISSYELAAKMQLRASEAGDLDTEPAYIREMYCTDDANKNKAGFGRNCLLARRLLERGVRFVQVFNGAYAMGEGVGNWDGHKMLHDQYTVHAPIFDEPAAALIKDLKQRGMLDDTLVIWGGEFGRTSDSQGAKGRDHNPNGFTIWMAGAGVKGGHHHGATDPFGYKAVEDKVHVNDLHATLLHLMGIDHLKLTHRFNGRDFRLTDVGGEVLRGILA